MRRYRGVLQQVAQAVTLWGELRGPTVRFVAQLGDLIDGQNAGKYGAGLDFDAPQSETAMEKVLTELRRSEIPMYHAVGNHELYNFDWAVLRNRLNDPVRRWKVADHPRDGVSQGSSRGFYFSFRPMDGWTFVVLNAYEVSLMQDQSLPGYRLARDLILEHNPNDVIGSDGVDFYQGLHGRARKYVPFNGGLGAEQLQWLRREVVAARERGDRIVVLSHLPADHRAASFGTVMYDCDECIKILHEYGKGRAVALLAGHRHAGGYVRDEEGLHHVTLEAPLTHEDAFGYVDVFPDRLEIVGMKGLTSRVLPFPDLLPVPKTATPASRL